MYKNPLKEKMQQQVPVSGCMVQACVPSIVEICGLAGFDFVFLDAEHGAISPKDCEELVRAAEETRFGRDHGFGRMATGETRGWIEERPFQMKTGTHQRPQSAFSESAS